MDSSYQPVSTKPLGRKRWNLQMFHKAGAPAAKRIELALRVKSAPLEVNGAEAQRSLPLYNAALCGNAGTSKYFWPLFLNLSIYSSLLQEMGGASAMESVSARATFVSRQVRMNYCSM
jgi:hypothetical protein